MAEEAAFSAVGKIAENLATLIGRQLRYVFCYKGNIKKMKNQFDQLEARRSEVNRLVEAATNNCDVVGSGVELWLNSVEEEKNKVASVISEIEKIGHGCVNVWCLHLKSRYWLSRKATKRTQDLVELLAQGEFPTVDYPKPALGKVPTSTDNSEQVQLVVVEDRGDGKSVLVSNVASASTSNSGVLESRLAILGNVMEAVRDVNIQTIGICGMGGVGKTTLVKEVAKLAKDDHLFDEIAIAVVSQNPDVKSIQLGIADFLGLKLTEDSMLARASRLHERLNQKGPDGKLKRILVILDDLWKKLDLEEVGIRYPDDQGGCKVVFTSRKVGLCRHMKAVPLIIKVLPEEEAWSLFQSCLQTNVSYPIAKAIVAECKGLPIAITTIAMLLEDEEENTWNDVLRQLKTSALQGEYKEVYMVFKGFQINLKKIEVIGCNNLKRILPLSITRGMDMLEEVRVSSCDTMEEIFSEERGGGEDEETSIAVVASKITFPKLKLLELKDLPNLVSFCRSVHLVTVPPLRWLNLIDVPKFHGLCNGMKSLVSDHKVLSQGEHLATIFPANIVQQLHNLGLVC